MLKQDIVPISKGKLNGNNMGNKLYLVTKTLQSIVLQKTNEDFNCIRLTK